MAEDVWTRTLRKVVVDAVKLKFILHRRRWIDGVLVIVIDRDVREELKFVVVTRKSIVHKCECAEGDVISRNFYFTQLMYNII